jgi:WD40 repeat protein
MTDKEAGYRLAWSPDSVLLAVGTFQRGVSVWDFENHRLLWGLGESSINGYPAWSPDGSKLVYPEKLAEGLYVPAIWNIKTQTSEMNYQGYMNGTASSWSPDGTRLAFEGPSAILIWDFSANAMANAGVLPDTVYSAGIRWSPDGKYLAISTYSYALVMDVSAPQSPPIPMNDPQNPSLTTGEVLAMAWSSDSTTLAVSQGTYVTLYNVATGLPDTANQSFSHPSSAAGVSFSPDGSTLATASGDGTVQFWPVKKTTP